jgi:hypothetical protein
MTKELGILKDKNVPFCGHFGICCHSLNHLTLNTIFLIWRDAHQRLAHALPQSSAKAQSESVRPIVGLTNHDPTTKRSHNTTLPAQAMRGKQDRVKNG